MEKVFINFIVFIFANYVISQQNIENGNTCVSEFNAIVSSINRTDYQSQFFDCFFGIDENCDGFSASFCFLSFETGTFETLQLIFVKIDIIVENFSRVVDDLSSELCFRLGYQTFIQLLCNVCFVTWELLSFLDCIFYFLL